MTWLIKLWKVFFFQSIKTFLETEDLISLWIISLSLSHRNILLSILLTKNPSKLIPIFMFGYRGLQVCGHAPLIGHSSRVLHKRKDKTYQILTHSLIRKHGLNYNKYHCWLGKKKISKTKNCNNKVFKPQMKLWMVLIINKIIF